MIEGNMNAYMSAVHTQISLMQKHERAPTVIKTVYQGREDPAFWKVLGLERAPNQPYQQFGEWSYLYIDVSKVPLSH